MLRITDVIKSIKLRYVKCYVCRHYLTVTPILINTATGLNICGRCKPPSKSLVSNKVFAILARQFSFPCRYTAEGCLTCLSFSEISKHEIICSYRKLKCQCDWTGPPVGLKKHFENRHRNLIITNGDTASVRGSEVYFLLIHSNLHFYVHFMRNSANKYTLTVVGLTEHDTDSKAEFTCKLLHTNLEKKFQLNEIVDLSFTVMPSKVVLNSEIANNYVERIWASITCPYCFIIMAPPIIKCSKGHLTCVECTRMKMDYCSECKTSNYFTCVRELELIATLVSFSCKWYCGRQFNSNEIRYHEQICDKRIYKCWNNCRWVGGFDALKTHDPECNLNIRGQEFLIIEQPEATFAPLLDGEVRGHLFVYKRRFKLNLKFERHRTSLNISIYDVHDFPDFSFHATLKWPNQRRLPCIKPYKLSCHRDGIYRLTFSRADVAKFRRDFGLTIVVTVKCLEEGKRKEMFNTLYQHFGNYKKL